MSEHTVVPVSQLDWIREHAKLSSDGLRCKKTENPITAAPLELYVGRSRELKIVIYFYCDACTPDPWSTIQPRRGDHITEEVINGSSIHSLIDCSRK